MTIYIPFIISRRSLSMTKSYKSKEGLKGYMIHIFVTGACINFLGKTSAKRNTVCMTSAQYCVLRWHTTVLSEYCREHSLHLITTLALPRPPGISTSSSPVRYMTASPSSLQLVHLGFTYHLYQYVKNEL